MEIRQSFLVFGFIRHIRSESEFIISIIRWRILLSFIWCISFIIWQIWFLKIWNLLIVRKHNSSSRCHFNKRRILTFSSVRVRCLHPRPHKDDTNHVQARNQGAAEKSVHRKIDLHITTPYALVYHTPFYTFKVRGLFLRLWRTYNIPTMIIP